MASKKGVSRTGVRMTKDGPKIVQTKKPRGIASAIVKKVTGR